MRRLLVLIIAWLCSISLSAQYEVGKSYFGINRYVEYIPGDLPIILSSPHAGDWKPDTLPDVHNRGKDNGTMELTLLLKDSIPEILNGCRPHIIINHLHASKFSPVHEKTEAAGNHPWTRQAWDEFHEYIDSAKAKVIRDWGKGHYFELHGNGHSDAWTEVGLGISKAYLNQGDSAILSREKNTTVVNLTTNEGVDLLELINGKTSLGGMLINKGWKSVPSPIFSSPDSGGFFYAGWNTWKHGSYHGGTIDATHLESYWAFMVRTSNRYKYAGDVAHSIIDFMKIHYGLDLDCSVLGQVETLETLEFAKNEHVRIYPNPSNGEVFIQIKNPQEVNKIDVINITGTRVSSITNPKSFQHVEIDNGFYFFKVLYQNNKMESRKILIQH